MAENLIPELTLTPGDAAVQEAPAPEPVQAPAEPVETDYHFTPEEEKAVEEFSKKIDITKTDLVLEYGSAAQKKVADFSETALSSVRNKDLGSAGQSLSDLVSILDNFKAPDEKEKKGFGRVFKKTEDKVQSLKAQYSKVEASVDKVTRELKNHQLVLMKDIETLEQLYEKNLQYYKELTMYIAAGKMRLAEVRATDLEELRRQAEKTGSQEDAQRYNDMVQMCERFDKKLHDLDLTRMVSLQMGPQTRLLQNNDAQLIEKIQSSLVNTIPLWKNQMVLTLGLEHSQQAAAAQNAVSEWTNTLLKSNAEKLHMSTVATARESERGIVDIETLQHTNQELIATLDEVLNIQREGAEKRRAAEVELNRIEGELRRKLMELNR